MDVDAALAQVLSVGVVWISFHCAGMCGPIVGGVIGGRSASPLVGLWDLLRYQLGRMVTLGALGAAAGAVGATFEAMLEKSGAVLTLVVAAALLLSLLPPRRALVPIGSRRRARAAPRRWAERAAQALAGAAAAVDRRVGRRPWLLGLLLGLLPCMITAWGLSLAASTGDVLRGARVMLVLVAMTTAPLAASVVLVASGARTGAVARLLLRAPWLRALPVLVSVAWLVLVGLAGLGVLEHRHIVVDVAGPRTIMLW